MARAAVNLPPTLDHFGLENPASKDLMPDMGTDGEQGRGMSRPCLRPRFCGHLGGRSGRPHILHELSHRLFEPRSFL